MQAYHFATLSMVLVFIGLTLCFVHSFSFSRLKGMHDFELPLWYKTRPLPTLYVSIVALLLLPALASLLAYAFIHFAWYYALGILLLSLVAAMFLEPCFSPMLLVLATGTPYCLIATCIWFLET